MYPLLTLLLPVLWVTAMAAGTDDRRFVGVGSKEFRRVAVAALGVISVVGTFSWTSAVRRIEADTVAVLACPQLDGPALRRLAWELEPTGADLIAAPTPIDVAAPRPSIRPVGQSTCIA